MSAIKQPVLNFRRIEKKYLLTGEQYQQLIERFGSMIKPDAYPLTTICNIYYDTPDHELIRRSLEHPVYKEKLRLRSYGVPDDSSTVFVELKKKYKKVVYKRRIALPLKDAQAYLNGGIVPDTTDPFTTNEISFFIQRYKPAPALFLAYDRQSFVGVDDPTLRLTFDSRIRSRETELSLSAGDYGKLLLPEDSRLMELKVGGALPLWLVGSLSDMKIYPVSFSKYGKVYSAAVLAKRSTQTQEG